MNDKEKIESYRENIVESLRILDEIIEIIRFQDNPEDTIIDQKLEEIKKILNRLFLVGYEKIGRMQWQVLVYLHQMFTASCKRLT